jgi:hypothetical protein
MPHMPHIDILAEVAARDPEVVLIERLPTEMPADVHNADQSAGRTGGALDDADPDEQASHVDNGGWAAGAPARSVRRATARRASTRRATARNRRTTARRASSTSSPSTREARLVASPKA